MNLNLLQKINSNETHGKIEGFKTLSAGWHFGTGVVPQESVIQRASFINSVLLDEGFSETDAFPGIEGEIQVTGYRGDMYIEVTIQKDDSATFVLEDADRLQVYEEKLSIADVVTRIKFWGTKWVSSGSSIQNTTTPVRNVSKAWHSGLPAMGAGFPSFAMSVSKGPEIQYVRTSGSSTPKKVGQRRFFGTSPQIHFQNIARSPKSGVLQGMNATTTL